jgi:hypothetical protein
MDPVIGLDVQKGKAKFKSFHRRNPLTRRALYSSTTYWDCLVQLVLLYVTIVMIYVTAFSFCNFLEAVVCIALFYYAKGHKRTFYYSIAFTPLIVKYKLYYQSHVVLRIFMDV